MSYFEIGKREAIDRMMDGNLNPCDVLIANLDDEYFIKAHKSATLDIINMVIEDSSSIKFFEIFY